MTLLTGHSLTTASVELGAIYQPATHGGKMIDGDESTTGAPECTIIPASIISTAWIRVDLGQSVDVSGVEVLARGDCCGMVLLILIAFHCHLGTP